MNLIISKIPLYREPTVIVVSVSGGLDSDASAIVARQLFPDLPIILWHAFMQGMDWPYTLGHLASLATSIGNCTLEIWQSVYRMTGGRTPTGACSTEFVRIHDVGRFGPAQPQEHEICDLLSFTVQARLGQPPSSKIRYCTDYFKVRCFETWCRQNRKKLGDKSILFSGERWKESPKRSTLLPWEWRLPLQPGNRNFPNGWRNLWIRPVINLTLSEVTRLVLDQDVPINQGYFDQGESQQSLLDINRNEEGRARLSCVNCFFTAPLRLYLASENAPHIVNPHFEQMRSMEEQTGKTWKPDGSVDKILLKGKLAQQTLQEKSPPLFQNISPTLLEMAPNVRSNFEFVDDLPWAIPPVVQAPIQQSLSL